MAQTKTEGIFDVYPNMFKAWSDMFTSWNKVAGDYARPFGPAGAETWFKPWSELFDAWKKTVGGYVPGSFKGEEMEGWFKPFRDYMAAWTQAYQGHVDSTKSAAAAFEWMKDMNEDISQGINAYAKVYDAWLRAMDRTAREGYEVGRKAIAGEEVNTGQFFDAMKSAYQDTAASVMDVLKDTPFAGIKEIDEQVRQSLASFPEEEAAAKTFLQELFGFNAKMMSLSAAAMKDASRTLTDMLEKGEISPEAYQKMMDAYAALLKHQLDIMRPPAALLPGYWDMVDAVIDCGKKTLDVFASWLEAYLKLYQGIGKASGEIYQSTGELFRQEKALSPDEFYKEWAEAWEKATRILVEGTQLNSSIPAFVKNYTEWLKSIEEVYNRATSVPFAAKDDLDMVSVQMEEMAGEMEKAATSAEKKAKPRRKTGGKWE